MCSKFNLLKTLRWWQFTLIVVILILPLFHMSLNTNLGSDADGYIHHTLAWPPLYPLFLMVFKLFGAWQFVAARIAQTFLTFLALLYAARWIQNRLAIKNGLVFLVVLFMASLISLHSNTLSIITAEGISFPLFIITFFKFVEAFECLTIKNVLFVSIGSTLLLLTRSQFYSMYAMLLALIIWHLRHHLSMKILLSSLGIMIVISLVGLGFRAFYYKEIAYIPPHYQATTTGAGWEYSGWRFTVQPFFLAPESDQSLFKSSAEQKMFVGIHRFLAKRHFTSATVPTPITQNLLQTELYYMSILGNLQQNIRFAIEKIQPHSTLSGSQTDHFLKKLTLELYYHHMKESAAFYIVRLGYYLANPFVAFAFCITILCFIYRFIVDARWKPSITHLFMIVSFLFVLLNAGLISIVEVWAPRYFYYPYFLYFCFAALLANYMLPIPNAQLNKTSDTPASVD